MNENKDEDEKKEKLESLAKFLVDFSKFMLSMNKAVVKISLSEIEREEKQEKIKEWLESIIGGTFAFLVDVGIDDETIETLKKDVLSEGTIKFINRKVLEGDGIDIDDIENMFEDL